MSVMNAFFASLEKEGIAYAHFKSNKNLAQSFQARADFDVLIDRRRLYEVEKTAIIHGGKRYNNIRYGNYPGVDNWLFLDEDSGDIFHLHLHCQIATGKRLIKDYIIPWTDRILDTRVKDGEFDIYVTKPEMELLLLMTRAVVKKRSFSDAFTKGMEEERRDLAGKVDREELSRLAGELISEKNAGFISAMAVSDRISKHDMAVFSGLVRRRLSCFRRMGAVRAGLGSVRDYYGRILDKRINRHLGGYLPTAKTPHSSGALIAFVGIDGAGKSTVVKEIEKWLRRGGIDCRRTYMGIGDGRTTVFAQAVKKAGAVKGASKKKDESRKGRDRRVYFRKSPIRYIKRLAKLSIVYDVERNNRRKLILMNRYRENGGVCICDRFPQLEMPDRNDGPKARLHMEYLGDNLITRSFEKKEQELLAIVKTVKPDVVFRLTVDPQTGLKRKGDAITGESVEAHRQKLDGLMAVKYQGCRIVDIDTSMQLDEELLLIKKEIWKYI